MTRTLSLLKSDNKNDYLREGQAGFRCGKCKGEFQKPILATVYSHGSFEKYYACPNCLTKVGKIEDRKKKENKRIPISTEKIKKTTTEKVECKHYLGYLKKRPKNTPIPEECLTCSKMIECLLH